MPNTFAPKALQNCVKTRVKQLRLQHDGPDADVKEWHALVDQMDDDATHDFVDEYDQPERIPDVVDLAGAVED
jgi:hypothetical protein